MPHVYRFTPEEQAKEDEKIADRKSKYIDTVEQLKTMTVEELKESIGSIEKVEETELERRRSIESRLTSVLGMASISTALFSALISLQAKFGESNSLDGFLWPAIAASTYGMTQLVLAIRAAVKGLKRRAQVELGIEDYIPTHDETKKDWQIRAAKKLLCKIMDDQEVNNGRTDQLEVAHVALRNFLAAMLLLAIFWPLGFVLSRKFVPTPNTAPAIKEILSNPILFERLRGPAGPMGVQGPPGPPGQSPKTIPDPKGSHQGTSNPEHFKPLPNGQQSIDYHQ